MSLSDWHQRLLDHFKRLRTERQASVGDKPLFALEHGLTPEELQSLSSDVRAHIRASGPQRTHRLPWIVYAAEIGYRYSGDQYWRTFEAETPGWLERGDRHFIRDCFAWFHKEFGGLKPSGAWASHFSIICWPILHAILPRDLQVQLARILYELRHSFSADLFQSPERLGEKIAARSWGASHRFQNLAEETLLIGQLAAALLLEGGSGTSSLLLPATLSRISEDVQKERMARQWLHGARKASQRAALRGVAPPLHGGGGGGRGGNQQPEDEAGLAIEPRLILTQSTVDGTEWQVSVVIPDLSPLLHRFPAFKEGLVNARAYVAGSSGRPLARGSFLHGARHVALSKWPEREERLLRFDPPSSQLENLLATQCQLLAGPVSLFRIASDGIAYELRGLRVRPSERYVVVKAAPSGFEVLGLSRAKLSCPNVEAALLEIPSAIQPDFANKLRSLELEQAKTVRVSPAGLAAASWDGAGRGEWLTSDQPCIAIKADHRLDEVVVSLASQQTAELLIGSVAPGIPVFVELPMLAAGTHKLKVRVKDAPAAVAQIGELEIIIREPRAWSKDANRQSPFSVELDPLKPTLEQLWEGRAALSIRGPKGRAVCSIASLYKRNCSTATIAKSLPALQLPVLPDVWRDHFDRFFRQSRDVQNLYDAATTCRLEFSAAELGAFRLDIDRQFTVLRWLVVKEGATRKLILEDDTGNEAAPVVHHRSFEAPDQEDTVRLDTGSSIPDVPPTGGLYVARKGSATAGVIVPPAAVDLGALRCNIVLREGPRSVAQIESLAQLFQLWAGARPTGNLVSLIRRREVLRMFCRETCSLIGGGNWRTAEQRYAGSSVEQVALLRRHVAARPGDQRIAAALPSDYADFALQPLNGKVAVLARVARKHLGFPARVWVREVGPDGVSFHKRGDGGPRDADWICEFALRLASDPAMAMKFAEGKSRAGLEALLEKPLIARAARFLVLAADSQVVAHLASDSIPHTGWEWN